jgi:hypothetical protein
MRQFRVVDLNIRGEVALQADYDYQHLEQIPGAPELIGHFSSHLWRSPDEFECPLPAARGLTIRWFASAPTAGIATLRTGQELASLSLLVSGLHPASDELTLGAFQQHLLRALHDTGVEPAFGLLELKERPLLATVNFIAPGETSDRHLFALSDRCFAAAYFRKLGLA